MSRQAGGLTVLTFLGSQNSPKIIFWAVVFWIMWYLLCHVLVMQKNFCNNSVLCDCQLRILTFSAIALVRKRNLKNAHLQNERSNLILNVILLLMNILQVVNAVRKIRKYLIVISMHKKKKFLLKRENESRNTTKPNLIAASSSQFSIFFVFCILFKRDLANVSSSLLLQFKMF